MGKRKQYTPEERAAVDAADRAHKDVADQALADPDAVTAMISHLMGLTCSKLLRVYSLRNVSLIMTQAAARGITVTEVDTFKGWRSRGRAVRSKENGGAGLRIVQPKGNKDADGDNTPENLEPVAVVVDAPAGEGQTEKRSRFGMTAVFDISQTVAIEDFEGDPVHIEPVTDPAAALRVSLTTQLERRGYTTITTEDDEHPAALIDDDAHTVTVHADHPAEQLAQALALLRGRTTHTPAPTGPGTVPRQPAPEPGIPLDLGEYGTGRARVEIDHDNGRAYYRVTATNVSGCFTAAFADPAEHAEKGDQPRRVKILYGYDNGRGGHLTNGPEGEKRPERPRVNGIRLVAQSHVDLADLENMTWLYVARMVAGRWHPNSERVPDRTQQRTRAVVRAILRHFAALPEFTALFRRAAALEAPTLQRIHDQRVRQFTANIATLENERAAAEQQARNYAALASEGESDSTQREKSSA